METTTYTVDLTPALKIFLTSSPLSPPGMVTGPFALSNFIMYLVRCPMLAFDVGLVLIGRRARSPKSHRK
jgi:hypothetical protein